MSMTLLALAVAVLGLASTAAWFGISRRRKEEAELGVQALATMKWRECIALVLESLDRDGYPRAPNTVDEAGATDFMLQHGDEPVLLGYKHGTAYRLSEANLREFAAAVQVRGARRGLLITLGTVEPAALASASSGKVEVIGGQALWPRLRSLVPPEMLEGVRHGAAGRTRKGLWTGTACSVIAGLAVWFAGQMLDPPQAAAQPATASAVVDNVAAPAAAASAVAISDQAMMRQLEVTARAMEAVARLSPEELIHRRADVAKQVGRLAQVTSANWSAQRTLLLRLNQTDGKDKRLVDDVCRIVTQNEEMRFTRIQLEPPEGSPLAVRWRLCE